MIGQAFVVTLADEPLYRGLFHDPGGAAAIQCPVIHIVGFACEIVRIRQSPVPRHATQVLDAFIDKLQEPGEMLAHCPAPVIALPPCI